MQVNLKLSYTAGAEQAEDGAAVRVPGPHKARPLARLIETWEEDLRQMWAAITKPPDYDQYSFTDFFE